MIYDIIIKNNADFTCFYNFQCPWDDCEIYEYNIIEKWWHRLCGFLKIMRVSKNHAGFVKIMRVSKNHAGCLKVMWVFYKSCLGTIGWHSDISFLWRSRFAVCNLSFLCSYWVIYKQGRHHGRRLCAMQVFCVAYFFLWSLRVFCVACASSVWSSICT